MSDKLLRHLAQGRGRDGNCTVALGAKPLLRGSPQPADSYRVQFFESKERLIEILRDATGAAPGGPAELTTGQQGEGRRFKTRTTESSCWC